jgi:hypothetical protein
MLMAFGIWLVLLLLVGYRHPFIASPGKARRFAWIIAIITAAFSTFITNGQPPLVRMLVIVVLQLLSMKILVLFETYSGNHPLNPVKWLSFSLGWFGMRPATFEKFGDSPLPFAHTLSKGICRIGIGILLLYLSLVLENHVVGRMFLPQLLLLVGLSLILHFGILNISTAFWRSCGVDVRELFQAPYRSKSLKEFWGKRWNIAFSEMTAIIAYRPLKRKVGIEKAMILSFLLSGLLHEIAISLPVMAGFGLPMLYFSIHALAMRLEGHCSVVRKLLEKRWLAHVWVISLLILPMPLLFHQRFIDEVLVPLRTLILNVFSLP